MASELPKAVLNAENSLMRVGSWPANKDKKALTTQLSAMARDLIQSTHDERLKVSKTFGEALEEAQSEIESLKAELAELSLQNQETSTKLREEFTKSFEIASGEIEKNSKPVQDEIKGIRDNAKELFSELTSLRLEIVDLADAVTADYVSHHFKESSRRQFTLAIAAFSTALVLVIGSVCLYAFFLTNITEPGITWKVISIKSSLTATILGAATIAIRIGFLSLRMANKFNRAELELKSINPLLQGVTGKDQAKVGFIERAFGYVWTEPSEQKTKRNSGSSKGVAINLNTNLAELPQQEHR